MSKPNVLFIMTDQHRYDLFSHRGNRHIDTPHLDKLAGEGAVFTQATCASPLCGPSRAAMLTGCYRYDGKYKHTNAEPEQPSLFSQEVVTIDELLAQGGYHTEYHGKWHTGNEHLECYQGDNKVWGHFLGEWGEYIAGKYSEPEGPGYTVDPYSGWKYRSIPLESIADNEASKTYSIFQKNNYGKYEIENQDTMTAFTVDKTIKLLRSKPRQPFAVTCSILHPHLPFCPNDYYADQFDPHQMPIPENIDAYNTGCMDQFGFRNNNNKSIPELISPDGNGLGQFLALYYALVKEVDDHVGRLLAVLEEEGLKENTLVIYASDHGDMGGSHNQFEKKCFYEEALRVPLIIRYPGVVRKGTVIDTPATGADIGPTILDYCGLPRHPQCHGESLRNPLEGGGDSREFAFSEVTNLEDYYCLRSKDFKVIFDKEREPFIAFDLVKDPGEFNNLLESERDGEVDRLVEDTGQRLESILMS